MEQHAPVYRKNPENKGLVMFIHGFMGSPVQFTGLIDAAYDHGYSVAALLLPGHGGTAKEFAKGTYEQWQNHVDNEVKRYSQEYEKILPVGHSMGGLLAVNASVKFPEVINGIFMIATPFFNAKLSLYSIKIRIKQIFSRKDDPIKAVYLSNSSIEMSPSLLWNTGRPNSELKILMNIARSNLPKVTVPVTAVFSSADELTSMENIKILKNELHDTLLYEVIISESLHAYYTKHDQTIIEESLIQALNKIKGGQ